VLVTGPPDDVLTHPAVIESYLGNTVEIIARSGTRT
jgi:hypothetical protein